MRYTLAIRLAFIVLGEDLLEADPYTLHKTRPEAVVMEGELIRGALR